MAYREKYREKRGYGHLSVSDLISISPLWCTLQGVYRLASRGHLPPAQRPSTIITSSGSVVRVDLPKMVEREAILNKGSVVHEKLEREVMGEVIKVETETREEKMALRIVNLVVGLDTLIQTGIAVGPSGKMGALADSRLTQRELPVLGFIHERLILGVIDEVSRRDYPPPLLAAVRSGFIVSDSKTRQSNSLPAKKDSTASRLQVTLYHRLFSELLDAPSSSSFSWARLWATTSLDPDVELGAEFQRALEPVFAGLLLRDSLAGAVTLQGLVDQLQRYAELARKDDGTILEGEMEVVYRLRNDVKRQRYPSRRKRPAAAKPMAPQSIEAMQGIDEALELARALATRLAMRDHDLADSTPMDRFSPLPNDPQSRDDFSPGPPGAFCAEDLSTNSQAMTFAPVHPPRLKRAQSILNNVSPRPSTSVGDDRSSKRVYTLPRSDSIPIEPLQLVPPLASGPETFEQGSIIGVEEFHLDDMAPELAQWLEKSLLLWDGERQPEGVAIENTNRCRTCEFEEDCEWRTVKALEAARRNRA